MLPFHSGYGDVLQTPPGCPVLSSRTKEIVGIANESTANKVVRNFGPIGF